MIMVKVYLADPQVSEDEDGDRFIEIWNVVFMQNEQFADGTMKL